LIGIFKMLVKLLLNHTEACIIKTAVGLNIIRLSKRKMALRSYPLCTQPNGSKEMFKSANVTYSPFELLTVEETHLKSYYKLRVKMYTDTQA
jgi:hypothetical protein